MNLAYVVNKLITKHNLYPDGDVLFEDHFDDGLCGWTWLMENVNPVPGPVWSSRRAFRGKGSMLLETGNVLRMDSSGAGICTAIKRLTLPKKKDGSYSPLIESEYWFGWNSENAYNPSFIQFGLDTQRPDITGYRNYFKVRFEIYDDSAGQRTGVFKLSTPNGYVNCIGGDQYLYWNEAKAGFFNVRFTVNIETGMYDKLWVNGKEYDISLYQCAQDVYVGGANGVSTFDEGMNFSIDLFNRLNTTDNKQAKLYVGYAKGSVVR
jgi:hypothetical protein